MTRFYAAMLTRTRPPLYDALALRALLTAADADRRREWHAGGLQIHRRVPRAGLGEASFTR
jgi:hypothetical protein